MDRVELLIPSGSHKSKNKSFKVESSSLLVDLVEIEGGKCSKDDEDITEDDEEEEEVEEEDDGDYAAGHFDSDAGSDHDGVGDEAVM